MGEPFKAFVAFLVDEPDGLRLSHSVTERVKPVSYEMARAAILCLSKRRGFSCKKLVRRCRHHTWGNDLLRALADRFRHKKRWMNFVRAVVTIPADWWEEYFSVVVAQEILDQPNVMELIIKQCPQALQQDDHPLFECFRPDTYWNSVVRRYIAINDYRRAYDEVKKACKGLRVGEPDEGDINPFKDDGPRRFAASKEMVGQLVREVFTSMVAQSLLQPIPDENYALPDGMMRTKVYETKVNRHHKPRAYEQNATTGFEFAKLFLISPAKGWPPNRQPDIFSPEGGMILTMARYFAEKKSEARRRRHAQAVAEYERRQRTGS